MIIRAAGTILLGMGFLALATAVLIRDPAALDANIGAGVLTFVGLPLGTLGLALTIAGVVYEASARRRSRTSLTKSGRPRGDDGEHSRDPAR